MQILLAVNFMHHMNIVHRDLKPENILLASKSDSSFDVRLADFGLSERLEPAKLYYLKCGTPSYIAPEILRG